MRPEKVSYHSEPCLSWVSAEHKDLESVEDLVKEMVTVAKIKKLEACLWVSQSVRWRNSIAETTVRSIQAVGAVSGCDRI